MSESLSFLRLNNTLPIIQTHFVYPFICQWTLVASTFGGFGGIPHSSVGKESTCNAGDPGSISRSGRSAGEGLGCLLQYFWVSLVAQQVKNLPVMPADLGSIPRLGRSPGENKGYPLQYSGLENSRDCIVHGVTKNQTWLRGFHVHVLAITNNTAVNRTVKMSLHSLAFNSFSYIPRSGALDHMIIL